MFGGLGVRKMFIPVEFNGQRKWANIRIKCIENKWFDNFGQFYTYLVEHVEVTDVIEEEELVEDVREYILLLLASENCSDEDLVGEIMVQYGVSRNNAILLLRSAGFSVFNCGVEHEHSKIQR